MQSTAARFISSGFSRFFVITATTAEDARLAPAAFAVKGCDAYFHVYLESQRGSGGWEFLGIDTESPYLDERPLLVAGTPEVRQYRARFWDKGTPNGEWTDVVKVTIAP